MEGFKAGDLTVQLKTTFNNASSTFEEDNFVGSVKVAIEQLEEKASIVDLSHVDIKVRRSEQDPNVVIFLMRANVLMVTNVNSNDEEF